MCVYGQYNIKSDSVGGNGTNDMTDTKVDEFCEMIYGSVDGWSIGLSRQTMYGLEVGLK